MKCQLFLEINLDEAQSTCDWLTKPIIYADVFIKEFDPIWLGLSTKDALTVLNK